MVLLYSTTYPAIIKMSNPVALFILSLLLSSTLHSRADGENTSFDAATVEFSVDSKGPERTMLQVVWKMPDGGNLTYRTVRPFQFEWMIPPAGALGFIALPEKATIPPNPQWIEITEKAGGQSSASQSLYISFKLNPDNQPPIIDKAFTAGSKRFCPLRPKATKGWCYLGTWETRIARWRTSYWHDTTGVSDVNMRSPLTVEPSLLIRREIVSGFPLLMRTGPSTAHRPTEEGGLVRPGVHAKITNISLSTGNTTFSVWAEIEINESIPKSLPNTP